jgi:hypothetical protein
VKAALPAVVELGVRAESVGAAAGDDVVEVDVPGVEPVVVDDVATWIFRLSELFVRLASRHAVAVAMTS